MTVRGPSIGLTSSSETQQTTGLGNYVMTLDQPAGFNTGWTVQIFSNTDSYNYMIGVITQADNDGSGNITVATFFSQGTLTDQSWTIQIVAGPQSSINPYPTTSVDTSNFITVPTLGNIVTFNIEPNKVFTNYSTVYCSPQQDYKSWFIGTVINYDPVGGTLNVYVTNTSNTGLSYMPWTITLLDNSALDSDLQGFASDTLTITNGSQVTFTTVQSTQFFPIQGNVLIDDLTPTVNNHYVGTVVAYTGNTLIVNITAVFGTGTSSSAWGIYLIAGPNVSNIDLYQINGLQMSGVGSSTLTVNAGSILDSTGTVILALANTTSISFGIGSTNVISVAGPGTINPGGGNTVVGTGTAFTTTFSATASLTDFSDQLTKLNLPSPSPLYTVITDTASAITVSTSVVTDASDLTTNGGLGIVLNDSYTRGGIQLTESGFPVSYGILLGYKIADGSIAVFASSFTPTGVPDLPSGYSYYRVIGYVVISGTGFSSNVISAIGQPLINNVVTTVGDISYFGQTVGPGGNYPTYLQRLPIGSSNALITVASKLPVWSVPVATPGTTSGNLLVADGVKWNSVAVSGDGTLTSSGALTVTKTQGKSFVVTATALGASTQAVPSAPTSNGTSVMKMMGFGTQGCTLTPSSTGNVVLVFDGTYADVTSFGTRQGASIQVFQGTGTAASSGAAVTGTSLGPIVSYNSPAAEVASIGQGFSQTRLITGLALGTTSWFDLAMASASSGNTITLSSINFVAKES